jgi:hypothetical protein
MLRSLFALLMAATIVAAGSAEAQPRYNFPPEIIAAPMSRDCTGEFSVLKEEIVQRTKFLQAAADRRAQPIETCSLLDELGRAELRMIKYLETHAAECRAVTPYTERFLSNHSKTEAVKTNICAAARSRQAPPDFNGASWRSTVSPQGFSTPANPGDIWTAPPSIR